MRGSNADVPPEELSAEDLCSVYIQTKTEHELKSEDLSLRNFLEDGFVDSGDQLGRGYRWFHLPANNMRWAKQCAEKLGFVLDDLVTSVRPALHGGIHVPLHARHMQTGCTLDQERDLLTAFLPYLNVDYYKGVQSLDEAYARVHAHTRSLPLEHNASRRKIFEHRLLPQMRQDTSGNFLHPRRTLDQFYYTSLTDTTDRDRDQTISKWTGEGVGADGRTHAVADSFMLMVDQLWIWVYGNHTILTCFPSHDALAVENDNRFFHDLCNFAAHNRYVWRLVSDIMSQAIKSEHHWPVVDCIEIYRWATSRKTARYATCFAEFHQEYSTGAVRFDDKRELRLALELADIIDELKMIKSVLREQKIFLNAVKCFAKNFSAGQTYLDSALSNVMEIKTEAEGTYKALLDLLDLKTKTASLAEARSTTKQGQAVMLFTVVTIIFLPLSFFTSYFGQNVSEITGDDANPTSWDLWKVGTPITVMIIFVALLFAYHIMRPDSRIWFWKRGRRAPRALRDRVRDIEML